VSASPEAGVRCVGPDEIDINQVRGRQMKKSRGKGEGARGERERKRMIERSELLFRSPLGPMTP